MDRLPLCQASRQREVHPNSQIDQRKQMSCRPSECLIKPFWIINQQFSRLFHLTNESSRNTLYVSTNICEGSLTSTLNDNVKISRLDYGEKLGDDVKIFELTFKWDGNDHDHYSHESVWFMHWFCTSASPGLDTFSQYEQFTINNDQWIMWIEELWLFSGWLFKCVTQSRCLHRIVDIVLTHDLIWYLLLYSFS